MKTKETATDVLRAHEFRATKSRIALLALLEKQQTPLSIQAIRRAWRGRKPDIATLYRTLNDLADAGIVQRVDFNTGVAHFEYSPGREHHHHIVCYECGKIEDIEKCAGVQLEKVARRRSKKFARIESHSLEFFGYCKRCA